MKNVHLMGICGMGMGSLALLLRETGFTVRGSDENVYPPMSDQLRASGIEILNGYKPENLVPRPDLVIVGNVIRKTNPEAQALLESDIPFCSMPEALKRFLINQYKSIVVTGTHGKSTTSTLATWLLKVAGFDPGAFIGGVSLNWGRSSCHGSGEYFVVEGDEYDTAFFDKRPKFVHYAPHIAIVTSIEYDHADIFNNFFAIEEAFRSFLELVPDDGVIIANWFDPVVKRLTSCLNGRLVLSYGTADDATCQLKSFKNQSGKMSFTVSCDLQGSKNTSSHSCTDVTFESPLLGFHNLQNTLSVLLLAQYIGIKREVFQKALLSFRGLKRRQEMVGEADDVLIFDDFAHHPTAVRATIEAFKGSYPERRLLAVFEPRSNSSRRNIFQKEYEEAFDDADVVCLKEPPDRGDLEDHERLDTQRIVSFLRQRKKEAYLFDAFEDLLYFLFDFVRPRDLVLFMSNGALDELPRKLFEHIIKRSISG